MIDKHISGISIHYSDVFWLFSWGIANISQCTWYNMPNLAGQTHLANFVFQQGHLHRDDSSSGSGKGADDGEQWTSRVPDHPPVGMIAWTSATATCTWNVGSLRTIAHPSRPWKPMLPRVWTLPWALWTCCSTISSDKWTRWWTIPWWPRVETPTSTGPTWRCYSAMDVMPRQPG